MSYEALLEILRGRRSVRRFQPTPLEDSLVAQVLEAARWAPSAGNRQALRFFVVRSRARIERLAAAVREATAALLERARPERRAELAAYLEHFERFVGAPVVIAPIYRSGGPDLLGEIANTPIPRPLADGLASVSAAIMSLLLAAHSLGLGACWMTGPLCAAPALEALLELPRGWSLAALVPLGYPDEQPEPPPRRALAELVRELDPGAPR